MSDNIVDFEQRYNQIRKYNMTLPEAVLAFELLDTVCLDEKNRQLALTVYVDLTFTYMKLALKQIFGGKTQGTADGLQVHQGVLHRAKTTNKS